jgi:hypothetical protein
VQAVRRQARGRGRAVAAFPAGAGKAADRAVIAGGAGAAVGLGSRVAAAVPAVHVGGDDAVDPGGATAASRRPAAGPAAARPDQRARWGVNGRGSAAAGPAGVSRLPAAAVSSAAEPAGPAVRRAAAIARGAHLDAEPLPG